MPVDPRRKPTSFLAQFLFAWAIAAVALLHDPFGYASVTSAYSQDLLNRILGPFYPHIVRMLRGTEERADKYHSSVVLIDEQSLARMQRNGGRRWPAPPSFHAMILEAILAYGPPRAVMVDLLFIDAVSESTASFRRALQRYDRRGIPVIFMGAASRGTTDHGYGPQESAPAAYAARSPETGGGSVAPFLAPLSEELDNVYIVPATVEPENGVIRRYPLRAFLAGARGPVATAAPRIYEAIRGVPAAAETADMELFWRLDTPPENARWMACDEQAHSLVRRFVQAWALSGDLLQTCPATPTVPAIELLFPKLDHDARRMIAGKVVFYGAMLEGGDLYATPVHRAIPGVYVHAMALDNLLDFDGDIPRRTVTTPVGELDQKLLNLIVAAPINALVVAMYLTFMQPSLARAGRLAEGAGHLVLLGLSALAMLAVVSLLFVGLRLAPINWLGLVTLSFPAGLIAKRRRLEAAWARSRALWLWLARPRAGGTGVGDGQDH